MLLETNDAGNFQGRVYQRLATASDAGTTYAFAPSGMKGSGGLVVVRGAAGLVSAADALGSAAGTKTSTVVAPSMNVTQAGSLLLALYGVKQSGVSLSAPLGMTSVYPTVGTKGTSNVAFAESRVVVRPAERATVEGVVATADQPGRDRLRRDPARPPGPARGPPCARSR